MRRCCFFRSFAVAALVAVPPFAPRADAKDNAAQADKLFSGREIPHLVIQIPDEEMEILRDQKRQNGKAPARTNVLVTIRDGDSFFTNVALHLKGSASFRGIDSKPALTLIFDKYEEKQRFRGLQKISLNNSMHDSTYLCEKLGREIYTAAGIPVPRVAHATVELNGRDLGVFVLAEGWNKQFLKRHFRDPDGNFYERASKAIDVTAQLELKSGDQPEDHRALKALADAVQETDPQERWRKLGKTLDVDQFITGMAVEIMIGHWDGYCRNRNNFRVFHDRTQDRIVFLPHGMDQLFGVRRGGNDMMVAGSMKGLVAIAVMESPEGCRRYIQRMDELLEKYFDVAGMTNRVIETSERLRPFLESDPGMLETNQNAVARLLERIPQRYESVRQQLTALQTPLPIGHKESVAAERWESRRDSGNPTLAKDARSALQITGTGSLTCIGSWRAVFLLEPGRYQLVGDVSVEQLRRGDTRPEGIATLRSSESEDGPTAAFPQTRTNLTHHFTVSSTRYVELICEYRGNSGKALFDGESIALTRLDGVSTPPPIEKPEVIKKPE
jgi:spore coat protein H